MNWLCLAHGKLTDVLYQETLNYWKQLPHVLKYFRSDEDPTAKLPQNFMTGFLEVCTPCALYMRLKALAKAVIGTELTYWLSSWRYTSVHKLKRCPRHPLRFHPLMPISMSCAMSIVSSHGYVLHTFFFHEVIPSLREFLSHNIAQIG